MSMDLMTRPNGEAPAVSWTAEQVDLIKRTIAVGATHDELYLFLNQAKRTGLDPLSRQIHFVKRKDKGTIQTAIDGYRLIADRTGKYAGNDDYLFDEGIPQYTHMMSGRGTPTTATATVYKLIYGVKTAFTATAGWGEYFPGEAQGFMWKKMPYLMIGKCAEALALRKAFPAELSGVYTNEEMMQADMESRLSPTEHTPARPDGPRHEEPLAPNYGRYAKQPLSAIPTDGLQDYLHGMNRSIDDPKKANFRAKNLAMREALQTELEKRACTQVPEPDDPAQGASTGESSNSSSPTMTAANVCQQLALCETKEEFAGVMNMWMAEKSVHSDEDCRSVEKAKEAAKKRLGLRS